MNANELMLWDWVYVPHKGKAPHYGKVTALLSSGAVETVINGSLALFSSVEPIPLTPEILEKNGFVRHELERIAVFSILGFSIELSYSDWTYYWANGDVTIRYVHELQHALRLCGIEKEIVL